MIMEATAIQSVEKNIGSIGKRAAEQLQPT